jgi:hypothetical protein
VSFPVITISKKFTMTQDRKAHQKHQQLAYLPVSKARTKLIIYFPTICVLLLLPTLCLELLMFLVSLSVLCHGEFFVLSDNLRILCFSCDAKMSKIIAKLFKKSRNKRHSHPVERSIEIAMTGKDTT